MAVAILGLGRFGTRLAQELTTSGIEVLAVDQRSALVNELAGTAFLAAEGDVCEYEFLQSLSLHDYETVVVAIGSEVGTSVLVTLTLKKRMGLNHVVSKASTEDHARALELAGADIVISPEQEAAVRLAHTLGSRHVGDYLSLGPDYGIAKITAPRRMYERPLREARLERFNVFLAARIRDDSVSFNPDPEELVKHGDAWVIAGRDDDLRELDPR